MSRPATGNSPTLHALTHQSQITPQLVISDVAHAVPLAEALVAAGLPVIEISLRTECALQAIALINRVPGALPGAGNLLSAQDAAEAQKAGAHFGSAPGFTHLLLDGCINLNFPILPGAATASEAMQLFERGFELLNFYPARAAGGAAVLSGLMHAMPQVHFRPCGGITSHSAAEYLKLTNVPSVAGGWMVPIALQDAEQWGEIRGLAHQARLAATGSRT